MNNADREEIRKLWTALDTRIETISGRTKAHTIQIQDLHKELKSLKELINNGTTGKEN